MDSLDQITNDIEIEKNFESEILKIGSKLINEDDIKKDCVVGEGGFGKVYKGHYKDKLVAIKKIKLEEKSSEIFSTLLNEIKVILKANNPEIPQFYGIMKRKGHYNLIFEFVSGKTLKEIYPTLSQKTKLYIIYEISKILINFHNKNLIHRDIKPGNIMIDENYNVKLIDFGVSKIASHTSTYTRNQIGTVPYMSPEQFQIDLDKFSDPNLDDVKPVPIGIKSDIWSLGVMISEIFSLIKPYNNLSKKHTITEQMITKRLTSNKPFPIPDNVLDDDIKLLVTKATDVDPVKRASSSDIKNIVKDIIFQRYQQNVDLLCKNLGLNDNNPDDLKDIEIIKGLTSNNII